jgi:hypothetical protein
MEHIQQVEAERPPEDSDDDLMEFGDAIVEEAEDRVLYEFRSKGSILTTYELNHATRGLDQKNLNPMLLSTVSSKTHNKNMPFKPLGMSIAHNNAYGGKALGMSTLTASKPTPTPMQQEGDSVDNDFTKMVN